MLLPGGTGCDYAYYQRDSFDLIIIETNSLFKVITIRWDSAADSGYVKL